MPGRKAGEMFDWSSYWEAPVGDQLERIPIDGSLDIVKLYSEHLARKIGSGGPYRTK